MRGKFVSYKSTALLALAAAVGAGVPFKDAMGHEYHPMPGARKREGRAHRDGTFTRTGAVPRARHAFMRRSDEFVGMGSLRRRAMRWAQFHKATPIADGGAR
jgi:hypothetical protein